MVRALSTSGRAVLFAGTTVVISLLGMLLIGRRSSTAWPSAPSPPCVFVMAGALTLLPAFLGFAGRPSTGARPGLLRSPATSTRPGLVPLEPHHPAPPRAGGSAAVVVLALAVPLLSMRLAFTDAGNDPAAFTTRQAYDLLAEGSARAATARWCWPSTSRRARDRPVATAKRRLATAPDVARGGPGHNPPGDAAVIIVIPKTSPQAAAHRVAGHHLRTT